MTGSFNCKVRFIECYDFSHSFFYKRVPSAPSLSVSVSVHPKLKDFCFGLALTTTEKKIIFISWPNCDTKTHLATLLNFTVSWHLLQLAAPDCTWNDPLKLEQSLQDNGCQIPIARKERGRPKESRAVTRLNSVYCVSTWENEELWMHHTQAKIPRCRRLVCVAGCWSDSSSFINQG